MLTQHSAKDYAYPIREIVDVAHQLKHLLPGPVRWENIGDPVARGHLMPDWMLDAMMRMAPKATGYCPTRGLDSTRDFLASRHNEEAGTGIRAEDILFFNGLGDAIASLMAVLKTDINMALPDPGYPSYLSLERLRTGSVITYALHENMDWQPDLEYLRSLCQKSRNLRLLLLLQPSNPLGTLLTRETMEGIARIAAEFGLIVVSDEIYREHVFSEDKYCSWQSVAQDIPSIVLKGLSKDLPWPGARCGWMEFLNSKSSKELRGLQQVLEKKKMLEVCATTLPQMLIPVLFSDERLKPWLRSMAAYYARKQNQAQAAWSIPGSTQVIKAEAAFYTSVTLKLPSCFYQRHLPLQLGSDQMLVQIWQTSSPDTRFCLALLLTSGICFVPLSAFGNLCGYRATVLLRDEGEFARLLGEVSQSLVNLLQIRAA